MENPKSQNAYCNGLFKYLFHVWLWTENKNSILETIRSWNNDGDKQWISQTFISWRPNAQSKQQAECVFPVSLASTANLKERISSADWESPLPDQLMYTVFSMGALAHAETSDLHCWLELVCLTHDLYGLE